MKGFHYFPSAALVLSFLVLTYSALAENTYGRLNRYWVALFPEQQDSPRSTDTTGFVGFKFSDDFQELIYNVNVHNIDNITGIYLYLKNDSQSATPVLDLLKKHKESNREDDRWSEKTKQGQTTGTINLSGITKKDLTGALKGDSIHDVLDLMLDGMLYVLVHTKDYPNGELRGDSFVGMDDVFHGADEFNW